MEASWDFSSSIWMILFSSCHLVQVLFKRWATWDPSDAQHKGTTLSQDSNKEKKEKKETYIPDRTVGSWFKGREAMALSKAKTDAQKTRGTWVSPDSLILWKDQMIYNREGRCFLTMTGSYKTPIKKLFKLADPCYCSDSGIFRMK